MYQNDTDAPAQGHPHPYAGILQKHEVEKRAITLIITGRFYPKSNLTYITREPGENHLTILKQNLVFPHVTRVSLEPQR